MKEDDVILIRLPQDSKGKLRPALVLKVFPRYGDLFICGITSKMQQFAEETDFLLDLNHPDFIMSGLKASGVIRLNMLGVVPIQNVGGKIGQFSEELRKMVLRKLTDFLNKVPDSKS